MGSDKFDFTPLLPCQTQCSCPLKIKLKHCQVYHIRQRHPAIYAVAFIDGANATDIDGVSVPGKCLPSPAVFHECL